MPSSSSNWRKYGICCHFSGIMRFTTSTGIAETYSSATIFSPERKSKCFTVPSSLVTISLMGEFITILPPPFSIYSCIGPQSLSDWFPSKKAICRPFDSLRNRFIAVKTTVMLSLSGSMKSKALAIAIKTSSLMRSGIPYFLINCVTESSSCASINGCPSISIGINGGAVCIFSPRVSIFWFMRMANPKLKGAGIPGMKSKLVNSPGSSCIAKIIWWIFHCNLSWMPSSANRFIMFGYAPKKMCKPVSIQSPSSSCHADTFPPSTSRAS
mmetsp:Transcript_17060/g.25228  ORF Transcript_17060/g.25228 Transcript_17060/m.25228 type:complete len:269 (-) Transcript_17060:357-1163(-)